jgi:hypothetical protein
MVQVDIYRVLVIIRSSGLYESGGAGLLSPITSSLALPALSLRLQWRILKLLLMKYENTLLFYQTILLMLFNKILIKYLFLRNYQHYYGEFLNFC